MPVAVHLPKFWHSCPDRSYFRGCSIRISFCIRYKPLMNLLIWFMKRFVWKLYMRVKYVDLMDAFSGLLFVTILFDGDWLDNKLLVPVFKVWLLVLSWYWIRKVLARKFEKSCNHSGSDISSNWDIWMVSSMVLSWWWKKDDIYL